MKNIFCLSLLLLTYLLHRVNLIGEHIDYCGYPVLPMGLEKYIYVAVASILVRDEPDEHSIETAPWIQLTNTDSAHPDFTSPIPELR